MGANTKLFWILAGFFGLLCVVYAVWAVLYDLQDLATDPSGGEGSPGIEWVGTIALGLSAIAAALIAFYVGRTHRVQGGELPEDRVDANIDDGDAEQGFFSPWSWWPITLAGSLALVFLGLAAGIWLAILGVVFVAISLVGFVFEHYRGFFSH